MYRSGIACDVKAAGGIAADCATESEHVGAVAGNVAEVSPMIIGDEFRGARYSYNFIEGYGDIDRIAFGMFAGRNGDGQFSRGGCIY